MIIELQNNKYLNFTNQIYLNDYIYLLHVDVQSPILHSSETGSPSSFP